MSHSSQEIKNLTKTTTEKAPTLKLLVKDIKSTVFNVFSFFETAH